MAAGYRAGHNVAGHAGIRFAERPPLLVIPALRAEP
jgi:hypothetical protein